MPNNSPNEIDRGIRPQGSPSEIRDPHVPLKDTAAAASLIGMSPSWLEHDRMNMRPEIPYVRIGRRAVRYRVADLIAYVERKTQRASLSARDDR
jgi:hypothetical protein